jgi:hypothetical protein
MMSRRTISAIAVVALLAVAVMASGCAEMIGQAAKGAVESATGVKVDTSGNSVSITGSDGSTLSSTEGKLPEGFPADVPVYEPGTITTGIATEGESGKSFMVGIDTEDAAGVVYDWYKSELESGGWTVKTTMKTDDGGLLSGEKGTTAVTLAVTAGSGGGKTGIAITVAPKE